MSSDAYELVNNELKAGLQRTINKGKDLLIADGVDPAIAETLATKIAIALFNRQCHENWLGPPSPR